MENIDNPQAFPSKQGFNNLDVVIDHKGMTLRDYLAGQALAGLLTRQQQDYNIVVQSSYMYADSMLKERGKQDERSS